MKNRIAPLAIVLALASAALLSGCGGGTAASVPADGIATTAENALEEKIGTRPDIDCGTDDIELVEGKVIDCTLTDPVSGEKFDSPVTIKAVDGSSYTVGVQVGDAPIN